MTLNLKKEAGTYFQSDFENVAFDILKLKVNIISRFPNPCPTGYHHNGFVATLAIEHMMYGYTLLEKQSEECLTS